jgi:hypothetical protein
MSGRLLGLVLLACAASLSLGQEPTQPKAAAPKTIEAPREDLNFDIGDYFKIEIDAAKKAHDYQKTVFIDARGQLHGVVEVRSLDGIVKPVAKQPLYLLNGPRMVAETTTDENGRFVLAANDSGKYQLAGNFEEYLEVAMGDVFREIKFVQNELQPKDDPFVPGDRPNPDLVEAEAIGTPPNRNASVFLDADGSFRFLTRFTWTRITRSAGWSRFWTTI